MLVPKPATTLKDWNRRQFVSDLTAGLIVAVVAIPLAIAFTIASGLTPRSGLYTMIVAGILISALGASRERAPAAGRGVANVLTPILGGLSATGAIAQTATNVKPAGRTPVASIIHALTVLLITLAFGAWAEIIPLANVTRILLVVAYRTMEWRVFRAELRGPRSDPWGSSSDCAGFRSSTRRV